MDQITRNGRPVAGFGLADTTSSKKPISKSQGFGIGASLSILGGLVGSAVHASIMDRTLDDAFMETVPIIGLAALGGGIAGAILAPGTPST